LRNSAFEIREVSWEIELNVCKHKDEEESKKWKFLNPRMNILFNMNIRFLFGQILPRMELEPTYDYLNALLSNFKKNHYYEDRVWKNGYTSKFKVSEGY